jgi:signal transduction histidine kinase
VNRFLPKSLVGQMALLIGIALLLAQLASFAFVLVQRQQFNRAQIDTPVITRFTSTAADFTQAAPDFKAMVLSDASRRGAHYELADAASVSDLLPRRDDTEDRLQQALKNAGVQVRDVRAAIDPMPSQHRSQALSGRAGQAMLLSARFADGHWLNGRLFVPSQPPLITLELGIATLLLYLFVLSAAVFIAGRIARPLGKLTVAAKAFRGGNEPIVVEPSGPSDLRNAILAFNGMNERLVKLLEEKDRTLGAIGHDLRTPLASLRIRVESVEPPEDRERMIATIEEMTAMLEDILTLARAGRSREQLERLDVSKLARRIADDYRELGSEVAFMADAPHILDVQPNLLRRALRNVIDNALKYAGTVEIEVTSTGTAVALTVMDRGPGLPPADLNRVASAFHRGEPSRNRETGGAGLGLSIAQAIAEAHGGTLSLVNRESGGLRATISLPLPASR